MSDDEPFSYVADSSYQPLGFGWSFLAVFNLTSESLGLQLGEDM